MDYFRFRAEAGQTFTFEVHLRRLQDRIHDLQKHADPMLTLFDARAANWPPTTISPSPTRC